MKLVTRMTAAIVVAALAMSVSVAGAFTLRAPQVAFATATLQGNLTAWDGAITAATDQINAQTFSTGITGNTDFTLLLKTAGGVEIGCYNTSWVVGPPALYSLFPPAAVAGWSAACHFTAGGVLLATLYDQNFVIQGSVGYAGVDRNHFGFYIQGPNGLWYSQDGRNGPSPQVLTYAGTQAGGNYGEWFECFEDHAYTPAATFTGCVVVLESVQPTPTRSGSWGALKASYR